MRLFVAVLLPEKIRDRLQKVVEQLSREIRGVKWVEKQNMHLTIKFLGEVNPDRLNDLKDRLKKVVHQCIPVHVRVAELGVFPTFSSPRVIWVGLTGPVVQLEKLAREVEEECVDGKFSEPEDRPWSSHITLGRIRERGKVRGLEEVMGMVEQSDLGELEITEIALMKSILTPKGPLYEKVDGFSLQGSYPKKEESK